MTDTPNASQKVHQAIFFLGLLAEENHKSIKDPLKVEAYLSACLGAIQAAFYRARSEIGLDAFKEKNRQWRAKITQDETAFFNWMLRQRDLDVHTRDPEVSVKQGWVPAYLVPGVTVSAPPGVVVPNPKPGGLPRFAQGWVGGPVYHLGTDEAETACARFLELMNRLLQESQT